MKSSIKSNSFPALPQDHGITIHWVCSEMCTGIRGWSALLCTQSVILFPRTQAQHLLGFPTSRVWQILDCPSWKTQTKGAFEAEIGTAYFTYSTKTFPTKIFPTKIFWLRRSSRVFITCSRIKKDLACLTALQQTGTNPWSLSSGSLVLGREGSGVGKLQAISHTHQISAAETGESGEGSHVDWWRPKLQV